MGRPSARRVMVLSGVAWLASWIILYREIFVWGHVTKTLRLNPPPPLPGYPEPKAGLPLLSVLAGSALAPTVFLGAAVAAGLARRKPGADGAATPPSP